MIKSISFSQEELLTWISQLYLQDACFDCDPTYSKGGFYQSGSIPRPKLCYDLFPQKEGVQMADCRELPLASDLLHSMIIDLPFLAATGASLSTQEGNIIARRFGIYPTEQALKDLYQRALKEAWRVLAPGGILVMKCQDKVSSGKQHMMHCDVYSWAQGIGFEAVDLFVLLAKSRLMAKWQCNQKHARKYHSYFWVFRKPNIKRR